MTQQTSFGTEASKWPGTRQNWAVTTPPAAGIHTANPSAPPSGWPPLNSTSLPGLASLMPLDKVLIDQRIEMMEAFTGFETKNKYVIMDANGHQLFDLKEDSSLLNRMFCGNSRGFKINVYDNSQQEVLCIRSPMECWLRRIEINSGNRRLGSVQKKCALGPEFDIHNEEGDVVLQIGGPICQCNCFGTQEFQVFSADGSRQIGVITKEWSGLAREMFTRADVFGVSFPASLDVELKALLIGTAILIDFEYYEGN